MIPSGRPGAATEPAGVLTAMQVAGNAASFPGACGYCSGPHRAVFHSGPCPRVKAIEYHPCGTVKRVEFHKAEEVAP